MHYLNRFLLCLCLSITTVSAVDYGDSISVRVFAKIIASITSLVDIAAIAIPAGILAYGFSKSICVQDKMNNISNEIPLPRNID